MRKHLVAFILLVLIIDNNFLLAQTPLWQWARSITSNNPVRANAIAVDKWGNTYTTGTFLYMADFDFGLGVCSLTATAPYDIYINKTDSAGNFVWAKHFGGWGFYDSGHAIAVDDFGNVYSSGSFGVMADFNPDPDSLKTYYLMAGSSQNTHGSVYISKLDSAGNFVWAKAMQSSSSATATTMCMDNNANVYIAGNFSNLLDLNPDSNITDTTRALGGFDIFVTKLDSAGNTLWSKTIGGPYDDVSFGISVDKATEQVYFTGRSGAYLDFDPDTGTAILSNYMGWQGFVCTWDSSGNYDWAKPIVGYLAHSIDFDATASGNVYVAGAFSDSTDFNPDTNAVFSLTSAGSTDIAVLKLTSAGNFVWAKRLGGKSNDDNDDMVLDPAGNVYIIGTYRDTADFDPDTSASFNLFPSSYLWDLYVTKLNANGNFVWAKSMNGAGYDSGTGIDLDSSGAIYVTGYFGPTLSLDTIILQNGSFNDEDIFIAKLINNTLTGTEEIPNTNKIICYPNPFAEELHLSVLKSPFVLSLYDVFGREVLKKK
ncbi:MAG: hypothetical protein IPJ79_07055 [Bacteroidetes bacterium]|nr:hypothetical protein [Bacteroidota bacterium]